MTAIWKGMFTRGGPLAEVRPITVVLPLQHLLIELTSLNQQAGHIQRAI